MYTPSCVWVINSLSFSGFFFAGQRGNGKESGILVPDVLCCWCDELFLKLNQCKEEFLSLSLIQPLFSTSFSECDVSENTNTVSWIIWQISLFRARCFPSLENLWLYDWERWLLKRFLNRSVNRTNKGQVHLDYTWNIFFPSSFSWSTVSFLVYAP